MAGNADEYKSTCFTGTKVQILTHAVLLQALSALIAIARPKSFCPQVLVTKLNESLTLS
jgi:hypothetical protein